MNQSEKLMRQATVPVKQWVVNLKAGKYDTVGWANTKIGGALLALEREAHAVSPPPPPAPSGLSALAQSVVFCAHRSETALQAPAKFKVALTADPAYAQWATPSIVQQFRAQGRKVFAWGNQEQIPVQTIRNLASSLGLDGCIFQAETSGEYDSAIAAGANLIVGNPNAMTAEQRADATARINAGTLAFQGECYTNLGGPWPEAYGAGGVPVCSLILGVYNGAGETSGGWNPSIAAYKQHTPAGVWPTVGVYHAAGVVPSEWGLLA